MAPIVVLKRWWWLARRTPMWALRELTKWGSYVLRGRGNLGVCSICECSTIFIQKGEWLRDDYICAFCGSTPRFRALVRSLVSYFPEIRCAALHESSPAGPASDWLRRVCGGYSSSQFFPGVPSGQLRDGIRCENLEAMSFPDESIDVFVTQDVMEHVLHPERAFAEIARVLKPGGAHVFTVPMYERSATVIRAEEVDGRMIYHLPKDYHGNPVDPDGALVTREWGRDLPDFIFRHSGLPTEVHCTRDRSLGLDGKFLEVFITRKPVTA